jgi:hypothetical protein
VILVTVTTDTRYYEYWVEDESASELKGALTTLSDSHPANTARDI